MAALAAEVAQLRGRLDDLSPESVFGPEDIPVLQELLALRLQAWQAVVGRYEAGAAGADEEIAARAAYWMALARLHGASGEPAAAFAALEQAVRAAETRVHWSRKGHEMGTASQGDLFSAQADLAERRLELSRQRRRLVRLKIDPETAVASAVLYQPKSAGKVPPLLKQSPAGGPDASAPR